MSGLNVPGGVAGISDQQQQTIEQYWDMLPGIWTTLEQMGFRTLRQPAEPFPYITTDDYENIEGEQYTKIMALIDIWFTYAKDSIAWIDSRIILLEEELADTERELKRTMRDQYRGLPKKDQPTETALKEEAKSYPRCREVRRQLAVLKAMREPIQNRIDGCERLAAGLSRQVTLRGQNIALGGRVGGRRPESFSR